MGKTNKYRRMMRAGGLWGLEKWLEETVREEWGCRALFIRTATLGPEALLEHSQNHKAANTEVQFTLFFSFFFPVVLALCVSLSFFHVSHLNLTNSQWKLQGKKRCVSVH